MIARKIVFLIIVFIVVSLNYFGRSMIYFYFMDLHEKTGDYLFIYLLPIVTIMISIIVFIILFDTYYVLFKTHLLKPLKKWITSLVSNYLFLALVFLLVIYSYILLLEHLYILPGSLETKINSVNLIYTALIFFIGLIYIGLASIRYIIAYAERRSFLKTIFDINRLINILWSNKGSFILWIFMGYTIMGAIGMTGEFISFILSQIPGLTSSLLIPLIISINTVALFIFYRFFVENYLLEILFYVRSREYYVSSR
uniref:Uncharacterized protein n=1 Tax=Staphylothermus marinus TaxID=2280 RepID=A0A7C4HE23_STAMA